MSDKIIHEDITTRSLTVDGVAYEVVYTTGHWQEAEGVSVDVTATAADGTVIDVWEDPDVLTSFDDIPSDEVVANGIRESIETGRHIGRKTL